jgi:uncharacterized protein YjbI with pentapeptide repeats
VEELQALLKQIVTKFGGKRDSNGCWQPPDVMFRAITEIGLLFEPCKQIWQQQFPALETPADKPQLDLKGADLTGGLFVLTMGYLGMPLPGADFRGAKLDRTIWDGSVSGADFTGASLRHCVMFSVPVDGTVFREADLSHSSLTLLGGSGDKRPPDFTRAVFSGATIHLLFGPKSAIMTDADLRGCKVISGSNTPTAADNRAYHKEILDSFLTCLSVQQRSDIELTVLEPPRPSGACFIATAACGTDQAEAVVRLREFRDLLLCRSRLGRRFIAAYERGSPPLARCIERSRVLRWLARNVIVRPASVAAGISLRAFEARLSANGSASRRQSVTDEQNGDFDTKRQQ